MNLARPAAALALALLASGCSLVPAHNLRLEEARAAHQRLQDNPDIVRHAPAEARRADEAFQAAANASSTLHDPALVDHLAYVAKQRAAIAAATAERVAAERALGRRFISLPVR